MTSSSGAWRAQMNGRRSLVLNVNILIWAVFERRMREMPENTYLIFPSVAPLTPQLVIREVQGNRFPPLPFPTLLELSSASYSSGSKRTALDLNHQNSHPVVPISSARFDQIHRVRSLVSALRIRKLDSDCQATDQSEKQEQLLRAH
jgi:hypothetical protein